MSAIPASRSDAGSTWQSAQAKSLCLIRRPRRARRSLLDGRPLQAFGRRELARRMAYVPQAPSTQFAYTVIDMVLMGAAHLGPFVAPGENDVDSARRALDVLGIGALG